MLFLTDYGKLGVGGKITSAWMVAQVPHAGGLTARRAKERITISDAPRPDAPRSPGTPVMRVELRPFNDPAKAGPQDGDVTNTGGFIASRAETYARHATGGTPPEKWPDPEGSTRTYAFSVYLPKRFELSSSGSRWMTLTQWKGFRTGVPPISLEISKGRFKIGGQTSQQLGKVHRGQWTQFLITIHFSPDPAIGSIRASINGRQVLGETKLATMRTWSDGGVTTVDPSYLKQGIYQSERWRTTHVAYFGPTVIATTPEAATDALEDLQTAFHG